MYEIQLVRLANSQLAVLFSHINSAPATSHLSASNIFLSQQISTSHQPAEQVVPSLLAIGPIHHVPCESPMFGVGN
jgi:hypothetical protein